MQIGNLSQTIVTYCTAVSYSPCKPTSIMSRTYPRSMLWGVVIHTHQTDILPVSEDYKSHLKSANSFKITKNKLYFILNKEPCMKKLCSLLSLIPLYKNGAGFTDIIHNSAEVICGGVRKKKKDVSEIKPWENYANKWKCLTARVQMKLGFTT